MQSVSTGSVGPKVRYEYKSMHEVVSAVDAEESEKGGRVRPLRSSSQESE